MCEALASKLQVCSLSGMQLVGFIAKMRLATAAPWLKSSAFQIFVDDCSAENLRLVKQLLQLKDEVASIVNM